MLRKRKEVSDGSDSGLCEGYQESDGSYEPEKP